MRIALVTRALPVHGGGGMERLTADLAVAWARCGHEVTCFTTPGGAADPIGREGVSVRELDGRPGRYSRRWRAAVAKQVDPARFDVVLGVSSGAASIAADADTPVIMQAHGTAMGEILSKLRAPSARALVGVVRNAAHVAEDWIHYPRYASLVAVSAGVAHDLRFTPRAFRPRRVTVILNGVVLPDPGAVPEQPRSSRPRAAFVGRLRREKGADLLVRAASACDLDAVVVGDGPQRAELEALAEELGLAERVRFAGAVDRVGVAAALRDADVVVLPSRRREGLPLVLLEALRLGRPAVVSTQMAAALPDDVGAQVTAVGLTPAAVAEGIGRALAAPRPSPALAERFDIETCAAQYIRHFEDLLAARAA